MALIVAYPSTTHSDWRRTADVTYNTAFTLDQGVLEVGILTPLSIGITDEIQTALHPVLLLLGVPSLSLRWRVTRKRDVTVAINGSAAWSFVRKEDRDGIPEDGGPSGPVGFPGTTQLTATMTFRAGDAWLLSAGSGPALDFLGSNPIRGMAEFHGAVHWLVESDFLLMAQFIGYLDFSSNVSVRRPVAQLMMAYAVSDLVHLGLGVGFGKFIFETSATNRDTLAAFPIVDIWFRL